MIRGENYNWMSVGNNGELIKLRIYDMTDVHLAHCLNFIYKHTMVNKHFEKDNLSGVSWIYAFKREQKWRIKNNILTIECKSIW